MQKDIKSFILKINQKNSDKDDFMSINNTNTNTTKNKYKHLSFAERVKIETYLNEGFSPKEIANKLNRHLSTIYREIKRNSVNQVVIKNGIEKDASVYFSDTANSLYLNRRNHPKQDYLAHISSHFLVNLIEEVTKQYRTHSIDSFVYSYKKTHPNEIVPCTKTIYNWIHRKIISIKPIDLPRMVSLRQRKRKETKSSHFRKFGKSIDLRPAIVNERLEFGHWEIDLVIGKINQNEPVLLTLVERTSRFAIVKKLPAKTASEVNKALKRIFKTYRKRLFKSITADNGSEFAYLSELEGSLTQVYFAHPYCSYERGSNEHWNGLLREYLPKKSSLKNLSHSKLKRIVDAINHRPRKRLNYQTAREVFDACACFLTAPSLYQNK